MQFPSPASVSVAPIELQQAPRLYSFRALPQSNSLWQRSAVSTTNYDDILESPKCTELL